MKKIGAPIAWKATARTTLKLLWLLSILALTSTPGPEQQHVAATRQRYPGNGNDDDGNGYVDDFYGIDTTDADRSRATLRARHPRCGVIAAQINNRVGIAGLNGNDKDHGAAVLGQEGGTTVGIVEAMDYMIDMRDRGINVACKPQLCAERLAGTRTIKRNRTLGRSV
jgi:hypothetical protein